MMHNSTELLLDLGNTRLKWAWLGALETTPGPSARAKPVGALVHTEAVNTWAALFDEPRPGRVWLASVAGARADALIAQIIARWGCEVTRIVTPAHFAGWVNSYVEPERLGVDRFLGMLGARALAQQLDEQHQPQEHQPCTQIVILAGTALTVDVIEPTGAHLGGLIVPGPKLMRESLQRGTAQLPLVDAFACGLGRSTQDAIAAGSARACAALIDAVAAEHSPATVWLCGGAASEIIPALRTPQPRHRDDLVMQGMRAFVLAQPKALAFSSL